MSVSVLNDPLLIDDPIVERRVRIQLIRHFEVRSGNEVASLQPGAQRLIGFLAINHGPRLRAHVAGSLWPDVAEDRAGANLRTALWRIKQAGLEIVSSTSTHVQLHSTVRVDLHDAERLVRRLADGAGGLGGVDLASLCGDLLPDWYDDWVLLEQERFRQLRLHALEALCHRLSLAGRHAEAVEAGLACVAGEPLRETAQAALIRAYVVEGNPNEAIRQYRAYEALLDRELGLAPSHALTDLINGSGARS